MNPHFFFERKVITQSAPLYPSSPLCSRVQSHSQTDDRSSPQLYTRLVALFDRQKARAQYHQTKLCRSKNALNLKSSAVCDPPMYIVETFRG